jgi:hypothetical protein
MTKLIKMLTKKNKSLKIKYINNTKFVMNINNKNLKSALYNSIICNTEEGLYSYLISLNYTLNLDNPDELNLFKTLSLNDQNIISYRFYHINKINESLLKN